MYRVFSLKNNLTYGPIIGGQVNNADKVYNNKPIYIKDLEENLFLKIKSISILGQLTPTVNEIPLLQGKIGEDRIAWGTSEILEKETIIFTTENSKGERKTTISTNMDTKGKKIKKNP